MQPVFKNASVTRDDIGPFMRQYAEEHDILSKPRVMLVGSFRGVRILLATPLLRWYLAHGLVVDRVYQIIEYEPNPCFRGFGESVSAARRAGDEDPDRAIIADTMKLLGNSGYGKTVTNVDRHRDVLHRDRHISAHQQQTVSTTGRRHRRRVRNRDEQECREVHTATSHRLLRLPVRQTTHATILLRLYRQKRRTIPVSARWTPTRHTLRGVAKSSMDSSGQIVVRTTSDTDPNGFRPNVATNTKTTMSVLE